MKRLLSCLLVLVAALGVSLTEDDFLKPVGLPPRAKPQRRQGGEAVPPLPLPATPLRRSEKKRPPRPATLVGKVIWGSYKDYTWESGQVTRVYDWNMVPGDCTSLLQQVQSSLGMQYSTQTVSLDTFDATPAEMPVLYLSGGRRLQFTDADREVLRRYLLAGGMVWFDSVVGSPFFYASALEEMHRILPEQPIRRVPLDHPLLHMIDSVLSTNTQTHENTPPVLDAVYIGSRVAAVVSPYGLGCGWDNARPDLIAEANYYDRRSATLLGLNLASYAVGYFRVGQAYAKVDVFRSEDAEATPGALVFTRVRSSGTWDTEPGAAGKLLRFVNRHLSVKTSYRQEDLRLGQEPLDGRPFVYLSGAADFSFTPEEAAALRRYLLDGGFLLIDNGLGMAEFDLAVRREMGKVLPGVELTRIPPAHPLFAEGPFPVEDPRYTLPVRAAANPPAGPYLEGIEVNGTFHVVYSRYDLAAGWQGDDHPLARAYLPGEALEIGANILTYFLTH